VIRLHLPGLYSGYDILSSYAIRVTRDADLQPHGRPEDLLTSIEESLRERRLGAAVRLQYDADLPVEFLRTLLDELELAPEDLYEGEGFTAFSDLFQLYAAVDVPRLKDRPLPPHPVPAFERAPDIWSAIRAGDVLVHHPYQTFDAVTRFVREAAVDPKVLAIKMTFYRVSPASPIAVALRTAVEHGKEVAVLVELQARFDEEANIGWARALEEVGAHVVYGVAGFKTHCKACLVVRQEADGIRRYCHLATGNYNVRTGGLYADVGLFTMRESFGEDLTELFNLLTGYTRPHRFHHLLLAPSGLRQGMIERIRREAEHARAGRPARIIAKMNGLVDRRPHRGAVRGERRGREDRSHRARHLLSAAGSARTLRQYPCHFHHRPLFGARAHLLLRERGRGRSISSPPPTGCPGTSTVAWRSPSRCSTRDCRAPPGNPRDSAGGYGEGAAHSA
jgi:polyphosphate kinase